MILNTVILLCTLIGPDQSVTPEGRLIFKSHKARVEVSGQQVTVKLEEPSNGTLELEIKKSSSTSLEAKKSERVYPSGSVARSYVSEESIKIKNEVLSVKRLDRHTFKKDEVRYAGEYSCGTI
jgi:hypothetical protein